MTQVEFAQKMGVSEERFKELGKIAEAALKEVDLLQYDIVVKKLREVIPDQNERELMIHSLSGYTERNYWQSFLPMPIEFLAQATAIIPMAVPKSQPNSSHKKYDA